MRRWNGWGEESVEMELGAEARAFLAQRVGKGTPPDDASFEQACAALPPGRLPAHALIDATAPTRVLHALGQSLPDWLRLRHGRIRARRRTASPCPNAPRRCANCWTSPRCAAPM